MTSTDIANYALAHIGEPKISDIDDLNSKSARICKQFLSQITDEVLRSHRWNCATKRGALTKLISSPHPYYEHSYALPVNLLRLLELNGEAHTDSEEFLEIEGDTLLTNAGEAHIRYIARIPTPSFDPLLTKAISLSLASTIAVPLTSKIDLQSQCYTLFKQAIGQARQIDAIETSSREGRPLERVLSQSRLIRSRFSSFQNSRSMANRFPNI